MVVRRDPHNFRRCCFGLYLQAVVHAAMVGLLDCSANLLFVNDVYRRENDVSSFSLDLKC